MRRFFVHTHINADVSTHVKNTTDLNEKPIKSDASLKSLPVDTTIALPDDVYHHWCRVLRAKVGQQSILFDGLGGETLVELVSVDKKRADAKVIAYSDTDRTARYFSTIAIVMSRGDRMDYAIQKSSELGATSIQLLTSQHGEVRLKPQQVDKKLAHWQQVALSACEQCGLNRPPIVLSPLSIESWLQGEIGQPTATIDYLMQDNFYQNYFLTTPLKLVLAVPQPSENNRVTAIQSIKEYSDSEAHNKARFDILIGAEGGLSVEEYHLSCQHQFIPWQLGDRVLRTETAPIVALSVLNFSLS